MLLDSNIIIYAASDEKSPALRFIEEQEKIYVSFVSYLEVLGYHHLPKEEEQYLIQFFNSVTMIMLEREILYEAVKIRKLRSISLGDSLIAATALTRKLPLVTHNTKDFESIKNLNLINPL